MLTIIATCTLAGLLTIPQGWTVTEAWAPSEGLHSITLQYCGATPCAPRLPSVTMVRPIAPGTVVEAPQGCTLRIESAKGDAKP